VHSHRNISAQLPARLNPPFERGTKCIIDYQLLKCKMRRKNLNCEIRHQNGTKIHFVLSSPLGEIEGHFAMDTPEQQQPNAVSSLLPLKKTSTQQQNTTTETFPPQQLVPPSAGGVSRSDGGGTLAPYIREEQNTTADNKISHPL